MSFLVHRQSGRPQVRRATVFQCAKATLRVVMVVGLQNNQAVASPDQILQKYPGRLDRPMKKLWRDSVGRKRAIMRGDSSCQAGETQRYRQCAGKCDTTGVVIAPTAAGKQQQPPPAGGLQVAPVHRRSQAPAVATPGESSPTPPAVAAQTPAPLSQWSSRSASLQRRLLPPSLASAAKPASRGSGATPARSSLFAPAPAAAWMGSPPAPPRTPPPERIRSQPPGTAAPTLPDPPLLPAQPSRLPMQH
jgi:hypothetical protein